MIIANPIYDVVFKQLMQNTRIARFFLETLTGEQIEEVTVKPQEFVYSDELKILAVSRYDFIATITTNEGDHRKVLIEIQKAKNAIDLMRFRNFLAELYKKEDEIKTQSGIIKKPLPIIAMYLLGFELPGIDAAAVKVARQYTDLLTHKTITNKSEFIERLSHDCYVVQITKIQGKAKNSLEELLSIFEQTNFIDENGTIKEYNYETGNEVIKSILDMLHYAGTDPARRKEIENEQEAWRTIDAMGGERLRELAWELEQNKRSLAEKDRAIEEMAKKIAELEKSLK